MDSTQKSWQIFISAVILEEYQTIHNISDNAELSRWAYDISEKEGQLHGCGTSILKKQQDQQERYIYFYVASKNIIMRW